MVYKFILNLVKQESFFKYYIIISLIVVGCFAAFPLLLSRIVETITKESLIEKDFFIAISCFILVSLIRVTLSYFSYKYSARMFIRISISASSKLYNLALSKKLSYILNYGSGNVSHKVNNIFQTIESYIENLFNMVVRDMLLFTAYILIAFSVNIIIGAMLLAVSLIYIFGLLILKPKLKEYHKIYMSEKDNLFNYITDTISNILLLKSFYNSNENKVYAKLTNTTLKADYNRINIASITHILYASCRPVCNTIVYAVGGWYLLHKQIEIHEFVMLVSISTPISFYISGLVNGYNQHIKYSGTIENTLDLLDYNNLEDSNLKDIKIKNPSIKLENVGFSYDNEEVLKNFNLDIKAKEKVALIGKSGAGKSTIVSIIQKFYDVNSGKIIVDNQNIAEFNTDSLRDNMSYIPQDPSLLSRSIYDNILIAKPNASEEEVINAAKLANAHEFIEKLPNKYKELVGERGFKLSGGQKQRIAIARAILKNAPILILDEATSALDSHSEKLIQESLNHLLKDKTCIIIAHRLSTIKTVDRILVLDNGEIVQEGLHKSLVHSKGLYKELWSLQQEGFIE